MSRLSKKSSRAITVKGRKFRWMIKGYSRFSGNSPEVCEITVQEDTEKPGGVLQVTLKSKTCVADPTDDNNSVHNASLLPSDVSRLIESALNIGWDPTSPSNFNKVSVTDLKEYKVISE